MSARTWDFSDYRGPLPKPMHWDDHPEWFDAHTGKALRIRGGHHVGPDGQRWYWGPTEYVREIGDFTILCYREDRSTFSMSAQDDHGQLAYVGWVGDKKLDQAWLSLDELLVDLVRFKHEGVRGSSGPRATEYFMRMISTREG